MGWNGVVQGVDTVGRDMKSKGPMSGSHFLFNERSACVGTCASGYAELPFHSLRILQCFAVKRKVNLLSDQFGNFADFSSTPGK